MRLLILFTALIAFNANAEQVYRQVDKDGVPSFSDQAMPGAEKVKIEETVTFSDEAVIQEMQRRKDEKVQLEEEARSVSYTVEITDPENDAAIRDNAGNLTISVQISPKLLNDHRAELLMDGGKVRDITGTTAVQLNNIDRGTHQFSARVTDKNGKTLAESPSVAVSLLRYSMPRKTPK